MDIRAGRSPSGPATRASTEPQGRLGHSASVPNAAQRRNLLKLAAYLESLPPAYKHFDMGDYASHTGDCDLPMETSEFAAKRPQEFLDNCGTVACAVGHGPAAGVRVDRREFTYNFFGNVNWPAYAARAFGSNAPSSSGCSTAFDFLFEGGWQGADNHHYGAAARIRYFLANGIPDGFEYADNEHPPLYAPYRKGSRSKIRRDLEQVSA